MKLVSISAVRLVIIVMVAYVIVLVQSDSTFIFLAPVSSTNVKTMAITTDPSRITTVALSGISCQSAGSLSVLRLSVEEGYQAKIIHLQLQNTRSSDLIGQLGYWPVSMDNSYPRDNRLIRCKCDNIRSSPCLAPRCRLILILTLEGLIVSQLKGYLSWVQTASGRSVSIQSGNLDYKSLMPGLQYERTVTFPGINKFPVLNIAIGKTRDLFNGHSLFQFCPLVAGAYTVVVIIRNYD